MKINTFVECKKIYKNDWDEGDELERSRIQKEFPYSVITEGDVQEDNMAIDWLTTKFGKKDLVWANLYYGKIGYDYGFSEFFFKDEKDSEELKKNISKFYIKLTSGKKSRTDGFEKFIDLE